MYKRFASSIGVLGLSVIAVAAVAAAPAMAQDYRGCLAKVIATPLGGQSVSWTYEGRYHISFRSQANRARREARELIEHCFYSHLNDSENGGWPNCRLDEAYLVGYPFHDLHQDLTEALCARNPHVTSMRPPSVLMVLEITGQKACHPGRYGHIDRVEVHRTDYRETLTCSEVRPGFNLPRGDYRDFPMWATAGSPDCSRSCAADDDCVAWTFKYATPSEGPHCFLKNRVPGWREDRRFVSGIKNIYAH